ncbi:hypothetical protein LJR034_002870 [Caballeronia sp. LjRoot34]|uniref:hypothetical protein n=1 Tax=Caballeronia sp. LjRoot34 TaxID=3342325 RepID=UPI003ED01577
MTFSRSTTRSDWTIRAAHWSYASDPIFYRTVGTEQRIGVLHVIHSARNFAAILFP